MGELALWVRRAAVVTVASALCIDVSCTIGPHHDDLDRPLPGPSRRLDEACRSGGCATDGSAAVVSGATSDSVGLRVGPGPGSVHFALDSAGSVPPGYDWHVELLVSGTGSFVASSSSCRSASNVKGEGATAQVTEPVTQQIIEQPIAPPADYAWVTVGQPCGSIDAGQPISIALAGNDESVIDIVDVRIVAEPVGGEYGCSMAPRGKRRLYYY